MRLGEKKPEYSDSTLPKKWGLSNIDEEIDGEFYAAACGGGWVGWHCEGSPIYSLFSLCFWHLLFPRSDVKDTAFGIQFASEIIPNVFVTPYQNAPLDLDSPDFYTSRCANIELLLSWLEFTAGPQELILLIGERYRGHFRENCRGMDWRMKLKSLQAIAVCIGGKALAGIFRNLAIDFKHFSGGLPDLLMIRVRPKDNCDGEYQFDYCSWLGCDWESLTTKKDSPSSPFLLSGDIFSLSSRLSQKQPTLSAAATSIQEDTIFDEAVEIEPIINKSIAHNICTDEDLVLPSSLSSDQSLLIFESTFVEVKGPTDRLSYRQIVWLKVLNASGIHSWVCQISEN